MNIYFSTVVRGESVDKGGEIVKLNWETKRILRRVPIVSFDPPIEDDPNPRGNSRGGRGILLQNGNLVVATYHSLHIYDLDLNFKRKISHPLFVGIHEICQNEDQDRIWVSSTAIDAVIGIDANGILRESWWPRERPFLQKYLSVSPLVIDKSKDNRLLYLDGEHLRSSSHLHLNAVAVYEDKRFALFGRNGMVYDLTNDEILIENRSGSGFHNLVITNEYILINHTKKRRLMVYRHDGSWIEAIDLLSFPEVAKIYKSFKSYLGDLTRKIQKKNISRLVFKAIAGKSDRLDSIINRNAIATPIFVRGLFPLDRDRVLIGFSPATIIEVDIKQHKLLDLYQYSKNVEVCTHGLLALV